MKIDYDFFKIKGKLAPQKGRIMISEPFLPGNFFSRSTVLLVEYSASGAVGFILNKPFETKMNEILVMPNGYAPELFVGGPVSGDNLFFIHTLGEHIEGSLHINGELYWGGDFEALKFSLVTGLAQPDQVKFFVGYSGWSPGQLDSEIAENSWLVLDAEPELIMRSDKNFWFESLKNAGGHYETWKNFPEDPTLN